MSAQWSLVLVPWDWWQLDQCILGETWQHWPNICWLISLGCLNWCIFGIVGRKNVTNNDQKNSNVLGSPGYWFEPNRALALVLFFMRTKTLALRCSGELAWSGFTHSISAFNIKIKINKIKIMVIKVKIYKIMFSFEKFIMIMLVFLGELAMSGSVTGVML